MCSVGSLRLVTFDVTNTLLRVRRSPGWQYVAVARSCGIHGPTVSQIDSVHGKVMKQHRKEWPNYGSKAGLTSRDWWAGLLERVYKEAGYNGNSKTELSRLADHMWIAFADPEAWEVVPHSHSTLKTLKEKGLRLGVVSNFDERLDLIMKAHGLDEYFEFVVTSVLAGHEKPDPGIFNCALNLAETPPCQAAHVGDDVEKDYHAARNVGMKSFLLDQKGHYSPETHHNVDTKHVIRKLKDLEVVL